MKIVAAIFTMLTFFNCFAADREEVFEWFKSLQGQSFYLNGSEGCGEISVEKVMYDYGNGPNTPIILIKSEELNKELHRAASKFHNDYRSIKGNKYSFTFEQGCDGEFFNGLCKTTFEITKDDNRVTSLKLVETRSKFFVPISKNIIKCSL